MELGVAFLGIWIYMALYYFFVFLSRRHDKSNLAYSVLCLVFSCMVLLLRVYPRLEIYSETVFVSLKTVLSCCIGITLVSFAQTIFDLENIRKIIRFFVWSMAGAVAVFTVLFLITRQPAFVSLQYGVIIVYGAVVSVLSAIRIISLKQYRDRKRKLVMCGFLALFLQGIWFMIYEGILNLGGKGEIFILERPGILVMGFLFTFALLDSFHREHRELWELKNVLEKKVHDRTVQLHEAHQQKTMLFVNLAHETKTPLTLIGNYLDQLIGKYGLTRETKTMKRNIDKLIRDIVNILQIEKLDYRTHINHTGKVSDLSRIIKRRTQLFRHLAKKRNLTISLEVVDRAGARIDPLALEMILNNLLDNAIKYNRPNGKIKVELKVEKGDYLLIVSDTGIGMEEAKLTNIFDQFYQISHTKRSYEGMGIGLHLVKKLVDEVGGEITVTSVVGKGSRFCIRLKKHVRGAEAVEEGGAPPLLLEAADDGVLSESVPVGGRPNVLVVEDNRDMLVFLQGALAPHYNFYFAVNGKKALELLDVIPRPDLIISDIMMDEMDGRVFLANLNADEKYNIIPFLFLTAKTTRREMLDGLREGAVDFITKPFSIDVLLAKIASILSVGRKQKKSMLDEVNRNLYSFITHQNQAMQKDTTAQADQARSSACARYKMTPREIEIVNLINQGLPYKEIAKKLDLSGNTVETYRKRIFKKCDVRTKTELLGVLSAK
jgi:signal transduction histidine kinase/DNA-binding NarL/FixJ family response regulator